MRPRNKKHPPEKRERKSFPPQNFGGPKTNGRRTNISGWRHQPTQRVLNSEELILPWGGPQGIGYFLWGGNKTPRRGSDKTPQGEHPYIKSLLGYGTPNTILSCGGKKTLQQRVVPTEGETSKNIQTLPPSGVFGWQQTPTI